MENIERRVRREAGAMTRREVTTKAIARQLTSLQAAQVLGITARHMRRIRRGIEQYGMEAVLEQRQGRMRRRRINASNLLHRQSAYCAPCGTSSMARTPTTAPPGWDRRQSLPGTAVSSREWWFAFDACDSA